MQLESLVVPGANAAEEAGKLLMDLPELWSSATLEEQRRLLMTMLDAVYVDTKQTRPIVAIRPKPPFRPIFRVAASRDGSDIRIVNEPLDGSSVFVVETEGSRSLPETTLGFLEDCRGPQPPYTYPGVSRFKRQDTLVI